MGSLSAGPPEGPNPKGPTSHLLTGNTSLSTEAGWVISLDALPVLAKLRGPFKVPENWLSCRYRLLHHAPCRHQLQTPEYLLPPSEYT